MVIDFYGPPTRVVGAVPAPTDGVNFTGYNEVVSLPLRVFEPDTP